MSKTNSTTVEIKFKRILILDLEFSELKQYSFNSKQLRRATCVFTMTSHDSSLSSADLVHIHQASVTHLAHRFPTLGRNMVLWLRHTQSCLVCTCLS